MGSLDEQGVSLGKQGVSPRLINVQARILIVVKSSRSPSKVDTMANLESVPEDIKHLIAGELNKSHSVLPLWRVSKSWRAATEPFVYLGLAWNVDPNRSSIGDDAKRLLSKDDPAWKFLQHARYVHFDFYFPIRRI